MTEIVAASLKSALCRTQEPSFQLWMDSGKIVAHLFANPAIALLLTMAIVGLLWWIGHRYLRQRTRRTLILALIALCLFLVSPLPLILSRAVLVELLPVDSGEKAAAVVVLGRGPEENSLRAATAATLWRAERAPLILSSGRIDAPKVAQLLKQREEIPESFIVQERCSLSTYENAEFTAAIMIPRGLKSIILVTDSLHMLRSLLTFKSFGFKVIPYPVPLVREVVASEANAAQQNRFLAFRESLGVVSYGLMGRYFAREVSTETIAEADKLVTQQLKEGAATAIQRP